MGEKPDPSARTRTAHHEAGHFAVAEDFGEPSLEVASLTVEPSENADGACRFEQALGIGALANRVLADGISSETRERIEQLVCVMLAGVLAEERLSGSLRRDWQDESDVENAKELVTRWLHEPYEAAAFLEWMLARTRNIVNSPDVGPAIDAVAKLLLERTTISGVQARDAVERALADADNAQAERK